MLAAASCAKNVNWDEVTPVDGQQGITLKFFSGTMTKADRIAVSREDYVSKIDYFIFPATEVDGELTVADDAEYAFKGTVDATGKELDITYIETLTPTDQEFAKIFPNGATKAKVLAIANYVDKYGANNSMEEGPNTTIPEDVKTWKGLHELEVGATFFYDDGTEDFGLRWPHVLQPSEEGLFFVMVGEADLELKKTEPSTATVPLERLASKITVSFEYENYYEVKENSNTKIMWVPQPTGEETRVYLSNAIEHSTLGGPLTPPFVEDSWDTATQPLGDGTRDIFEYAYNFMNDITTVDEDGNKLAHFYTYPISMEEGDDNQTHLKLVLPWYGYKYVGTEENPEFDPENPEFMFYKQKEVYYKIVLPRETINEGNRIYEYKVKVNIIGSDKEVKIIGEEYVVKDWTFDEEISSNVATGRYLSLDIPKDEYDMYTSLAQIKFVSSGKVEVYVDEIYQMNLSGNTPVPVYFMEDDAVTASQTVMNDKNITSADIEGWVTIPDKTSYLQIQHTLDSRPRIGNQRNPAFDLSPYVYVVTLHLVDAGDDTTFDRHVTITQYPSLYAISNKSNAVVYVYNQTSSGTGNYTTVYAENNNIGSVQNPTTVTGSGTNMSQYNIIIYPTSLDPQLGLSIGEARVADGTTVSQINGLSNYKQSRSDTPSRTLVSPGFMIASSYGKTTPVTYQNAVRRCATYQENGYPAGRWRIPTEGEIQFLVNLSTGGFIPSMFDGGYWASSQRYYSSSSNSFSPTNGTEGDNATHYVRCVYDVWFWGEEPVATGTAATEWMGFYD